MIQDIGEKKLKNEYVKHVPEPGDTLIAVSGGKVLGREKDGALEFPKYEELDETAELLFPVHYLFAVDDESFVLAAPKGEDAPLKNPAGYEYLTAMQIRRMSPMDRMLAAATGIHLCGWYKRHIYCGFCGEKLEKFGDLRAFKCKNCGTEIFPKIQPAVIVGIINGEELLLTKYAGRAYKRYALVAGYTEIGETAEATVKREVMEEVGLKVKNLRYYKSQPWGFSESLLLGFFCELDGEAAIRMDEKELATAEWVRRCDIPDGDLVSLTNEMMREFKYKGRKVLE